MNDQQLGLIILRINESGDLTIQIFNGTFQQILQQIRQMIAAGQLLFKFIQQVNFFKLLFQLFIQAGV